MNTCKISYASDSDRDLWDEYVLKYPEASPFHLFGWRNVIQRTYGHATYYLIAYETLSNNVAVPSYAEELKNSSECICGVLPLVHFKHPIFGNYLVSMPYVDSGGILASCSEVEKKLLSEAIRLAWRIGASRIELRNERMLSCCLETTVLCPEALSTPSRIVMRSHKVRMLLNLPGSSEILKKTFKSKLRNQINKPVKEGLTSRIGGLELLENFYEVFLVNMRDLGSPVHSAKLMRYVVTEFREDARIIVIYKSTVPVAAALVIGFHGVLRNLWASSLRKYASLSPNMLLYLRMLEYACDNRFQTFDFGRSSPGEGTYKFKEQWNSLPAPLYWYYISVDGKPFDPDSSGKERFQKAMHYWSKLPVAVTRIFGPKIRKHIGL